MATPTSLKYVESDSHIVTRSRRKQLESNARDNEVSDNRSETKKLILPTSDDNNLKSSMSQKLQSSTRDELPRDSKGEKTNRCRKKNTLVTPDLSKCSTSTLRNQKPVPIIKKETEYPSSPLKKAQDITCIEGEAGKSAYSSPSCKTEMQPSTTVGHNVKSARKLPNFASIHKKQFEKMESVVEWKQRKQIRSDMLMSPTAKSTFCFKLQERGPLTENVFKFTAAQTSSFINKGAQDLNIKNKTSNLEEMKKFGLKPNVTAQAKESIIKKLPQASREQKRAQERSYLRGVRLNKRFHLQMEMRKLC